MIDDDLPPQALAALLAGKKIEAIKQVRMATGVSLAEAKRRVDARAPRTATRPGLSPGEVARATNAGAWIVLVLAVVAGMAFFLLKR